MRDSSPPVLLTMFSVWKMMTVETTTRTKAHRKTVRRKKMKMRTKSRTSQRKRWACVGASKFKVWEQLCVSIMLVVYSKYWTPPPVCLHSKPLTNLLMLYICMYYSHCNEAKLVENQQGFPLTEGSVAVLFSADGGTGCRRAPSSV